MNDRIKILMATEGTYPFHHGGVSNWCDILLNSLNKDMDFVLYSIMMNPYVTQKFTLPSNVKLIRVPLWGTEEPSEHLDIPFSKVYMSRKLTIDSIIKEDFIPIFIKFMNEIMSYDKNPEHFGDVLLQLYNYFEKYEYKKSFKSQITWDTYKSIIMDFCEREDYDIDTVDVFSLTQSLGWIYRFMHILNTPIPKVNVSHSAAAAFCSIPCVLAKLKYDAPFLLTEHGVYLREQYLSLSKRGYSTFLNTFLIRLIHSIVSLSYYYADQVSPVCSYNTRWEREFGVSDKDIKVIYNGIDVSAFMKNSIVRGDDNTVTIATVARIDPVKDILTLIKAAKIVKEKCPEAKFVVYGSVSVEEYYEECIKLKNDLQLGDSFVFAGHLSNVEKAYENSDIIVLSSITEAFPYTIIEAMIAGKAIIATDVGGIREALGETGILITPRDEVGLAKEIINYIKNPELRYNIGQEARERALNLFTLKKVKELYYKSYVKLAIKAHKLYVREMEIKTETVDESILNMKLYLEKGLALMQLGFIKEGINQLKLASKEGKKSMALPYILTKIADGYNILGQQDKALNELEKAELLINTIKLNKTA